MVYFPLICGWFTMKMMMVGAALPAVCTAKNIDALMKPKPEDK